MAAAPTDAIDELAVLQAVRYTLGLRQEKSVRIGRYELGQRLGSGGGGHVYAATDVELQREVAIKLVRAGGAPEERAVANRRLLREARAAASVVHPNTVTVFDAGRFTAAEARALGIDTDEPGVFVVMERVDGMDLGQWLREAPRATPEILRVFTAAGQGLAGAHAARLVHRDFKPGNVLIGRDGEVKVTDFGLARPGASLGDEASSKSNADPDSGDTREVEDAVTRPGMAAGTPLYMSPEQHRAAELDARSDQFSFCVSLYEALFGALPYEGDLLSIAVGKERGLLRLPESPPVPRRVRAVLERGLAPQPEDRFANMNALLDALAPPRRARVLVPVALGVFAAVAVAAFAVGGAPPRCEPPGPVWTPDAAQAVDGAFVATKRAHAAASVKAIGASLQAHDAAWGDAWHTACVELPAESPERDATLACLGRQRAHARELLSALADASAVEVDRAAAAISSLPEPSACPDRNEPQPAARQRAMVAAARELVARAFAAHSIGAAEQADTLSASAQASAVASGFAPVVAEAAFARALAHRARGRLDDAREALDEAFWTGRAAKHDDVAMRAAAEHVFIASSLAMDLDAARGWERHLDALLAGEPDAEAKTMATALNAKGALALAAQDFDAAHDAFSRSRATLLEGASGDEVRIATVEANLGVVEQRRGELDAAMRWFSEAAQRRERLLGPDHPDRGELLLNVASVHRAAGRLDAARSALETAVAVFPVDHPDAPLARVNLGNLLMADEPAAAVEHYREAQRLFGRTLGADAPRTVQTGVRLAHALEEAGDRTGALAEYERVAATVPPQGPAQAEFRQAHAFAVLALARLYADEGRAAQSRAALAQLRALGIDEMQEQIAAVEGKLRESADE